MRSEMKRRKGKTRGKKATSIVIHGARQRQTRPKITRKHHLVDSHTTPYRCPPLSVMPFSPINVCEDQSKHSHGCIKQCINECGAELHLRHVPIFRCLFPKRTPRSPIENGPNQMVCPSKYYFCSRNNIDANNVSVFDDAYLIVPVTIQGCCAAYAVVPRSSTLPLLGKSCK